MPAFTEDFEGVANGVAVSGSNTSYNLVASSGASRTAVGDTSLAKLGGASLAIAGTGTTALYHDFNANPITTHYRRIYIYPRSVPTASAYLWQFETPANAACFALRITTTGFLQALNSALSQQDLTSTALTLDSWTRVEIAAVEGIATARLYAGAEVDNPVNAFTEQMVWSYANTSIGEVVSGSFATTTHSINIDEEAASDTGWVGPAAGDISLVEHRLPIPTIQVG